MPVLTSEAKSTKMGAMKKKNILWALLFAVIVLGGVLLYVSLGKGEGTVAVVSVDGEVLERIDLSKVREEYDLDLATEYGRNIVHVEPGAVSVTHADCPDQICVMQGKLSGSGIPIICMPNRLVISIEGGNIDG